jgi:DNA-binding response OmpR family regulator
MAKNSILVVEDDALTARVFSDSLERDGHTTTIADSGQAALQELTKRQYDLVLLDLDLGKHLDGFETLQRLRRSGNPVRVVIITGRGSPFDIERGLRLAADNYIVKPIGQIEFRARINTELRQALRDCGEGDLHDGLYEYDRFALLVVDGKCRVQRGEEEFYLAAQENKLVIRLLQNAGSVVPLPDLAAFIWNVQPPLTHHDLANIRKTIHRLRGKLERFGQARTNRSARSSGAVPIGSIFVAVRNQGLMIRAPRAFRLRGGVIFRPEV